MIPSTPPRRARGLAALACGLLFSFLAGCGGGDADGAGALSAGGRSRALAVVSASGGGLMINEVSAASWKGAADEDGDSQDWVEIYNPTAAPIELSGYGLSNKSASPFLWVFPSGTWISANRYVTVWLSKKDRTAANAPLHANFNLDNGADPIFLTAPNGTTAGLLVDSATPPLVKPDQSWCRMPSGSASSPFMVCSQPTKGVANQGVSNPSLLAKPTLSVPSGFYASSVTVMMSGPSGATLRYTTDGSEPNAASSAYVGPLTMSSSTVLRAAAFAAGVESSLVETATYIVDAALAGRYASLKAVLVAMPPDDLARFQASDKALLSKSAFEMVIGGTTSVFKLDAEGSVAGQGGSDDSPQRSMNVAARDAFGIKTVNAVLWPDKPAITSTKKFRLRNGSNDWARAHLRDQLSQSLAAPGPNLTGASNSVAMFINGKYYGLMDLREREDETLAANNLGIDKDYIDDLYDPLLAEQEAKNGGTAAIDRYKAMHDFVVGHDMAVPANYATAVAQFNPESLAWDWAQHMFHANNDWPSRNVHVWRSPEYDGRWAWHEHDMDFAFGRYSDASLNMNGSFQSAGSEFIGALLKSPDFRNLYLNIAADQMNLMTPSRMGARLDAMAADMSPYIPDFYAKNAMGTLADWTGYVNELRTFFAAREGIHDAHTRAYFGLPNRASINVAVNDLAMGSVKVNSLNVGPLMSAADPSWTGKYYPGVPITLVARPKPGYRFVGWQGASTASNAVISQTFPAATAVAADNFSVRWSGQIKAQAAGNHRLQAVSTGGARVWLNAVLVIDDWSLHAEHAVTSGDLLLEAGKRYDIVVEHFDASGDATMRLLWQTPGSPAYVPVPAPQLYAGASAALSGGLSASYFNSQDLSGTPAAQAVETIDFVWKDGAPAAAAAQFTAVFAAAGTPAAPVFDPIAAQARRTGDIVAVSAHATDPGGFDLKYTASKLPKGVNIHPLTGMIYGRITTPGTYNTTVTASNGVTSGSTSFTWTVTDREITSGGAGSLTLCAVENGVCAVPAGAVADVSFGADNKFFVKYGVSGNIGCNTTVFGEPIYGVVKACFYVVTNVGTPGNAAPTVSITAPAANASYAVGASVTLAASAADSDGSVTKVEFFDGSTLLGSVSSAPYTLAWTATAGQHSFKARATDNLSAQTTSAAVAVTVEAPVSSGTFCAVEGGVCTVPAGLVADVSYGARDQYIVRPGVSGSIACSNDVFGDPISGVVKACSYVATNPGVPGNAPPTVTLTSPNPSGSYLAGDTLTLAADAADSDGSIAKVEFFDGTTLLGSATSAPYQMSWTATAGVHNLKARATDNQSAQASSAVVTMTVNVPGITGTFCANEGGVCTLPAGATADVSYGAGSKFVVKVGVTRSIVCSNDVFGDPAYGVPKACSYVVTNPGVPGNLAPTVAIDSPVAGSTYTVGNALTLSATAADSDGSIAKVEFFDGSTPLGSVSAAPYTLPWTATAGVHAFIARATDNVGAQTSSSIVSVAVNEPGSTRTFCANEDGVCTLPAGLVADVYYGANGQYAIKFRVSGSIGCNNNVFGDPINRVVKSCSYVASAP